MTQSAPKKKVLSVKNFYIPPKISEIAQPCNQENIAKSEVLEESGLKKINTVEGRPGPDSPTPETQFPRKRGRPPKKENYNFFEDWRTIRKRHPAQQEVLDAFFRDDITDIFLRGGRKFTKTTFVIDASWWLGMKFKNSIIHICCPTISQAKEIYWDEKRLQNCDIKDNYMFDRYVLEYSKTDASITLITGSLIKLVGTWNVVKGRGGQPDFISYDEVQDSDPIYINATDANMAAKPNSKRVFLGTPPKKKNHYHEWEERTKAKKTGMAFHFSSYANTALPHLKRWLDDKKIELIAAGKEDEWIREYLAEDCFKSEDRILPDIAVADHAETVAKLKALQTDRLRPFVTIVVTKSFLSYSLGAYITSKEQGIQCWMLETHMEKSIWDKSYNDIFSSMKEKTEPYEKYFLRKFTYIVADETKTMIKILSGVREAAVREKKIKWHASGTNLLREMIKSSMITYTDRSADVGPECQNYLKGEDIFDYPHVCTSALVANEFYCPPSLGKKEKELWDKYAHLREAGIICNPPNRKTILRKNW